MKSPFRKLKARAFSLILCCALLLVALPISAGSVTQSAKEAIGVSAKSAVLMELDDGLVLYGKNADERMGEASTTKIMTALVISEMLPLDKVISVPKEAVGTEGSSVYLREGELLSVRSLLLALLLESANDAAVALAVAASGSIASFAELMNDKAKQLGLTDTHFTNPHGLYDSEHYTTARELAVITAQALKDRRLCEIFATKRAQIPLGVTPNTPDGEGVRYLYNHTKMLSLYEGAIGVKTGFTKATGRCLVSAAKRGEMTLICVTLSAPNDWNDHSALLDYGFEHFSRVTLYNKGELRVSYSLTGGREQYVTATNSEPLTLTLPKNYDSSSAELNLEFLQRFEFAPVEAGEQLGNAILRFGDREVCSPLTAAYGVPSVNTRERKRFIFFD